MVAGVSVAGQVFAQEHAEVRGELGHDGTIERLEPRPPVLDPLGRQHGVDENAVAEIGPDRACRFGWSRSKLQLEWDSGNGARSGW